MKTGTVVAAKERTRTVGSRPRGQTQAEVGPGHVDTLTYNHQQAHTYLLTYLLNPLKPTVAIWVQL